MASNNVYIPVINSVIVSTNMNYNVLELKISYNDDLDDKQFDSDVVKILEKKSFLYDLEYFYYGIYSSNSCQIVSVFSK